jgi:hypothetical protein
LSLEAADSYRVNNGTRVQINEHSTCRNVENTSGRDLFVPTRTSAEWQSFRDNFPSGVTLTGCVDDCLISSTGGTITTNGGYRIHTFTTSADITASCANTVEYLVVAGGGGGGRSVASVRSGGGGGGGGGSTNGAGTGNGGDGGSGIVIIRYPLSL